MQKVALNVASDSAVTANKMATELRNNKHPFVIILFFFSPGATTPTGGCILQPSSGL